MSDSGDCCCCRCFLRFILTSGLAALFLWLSLRPSKPKCSIQEFYVPSLNTTAANSNSTTRNHTLNFKLKLNNPNKDKGIHYDAIKLTFYYGQNDSLPIANYTVDGFRQGHNKHTYREKLLETYGVPWEDASMAVSNRTSVFFRVGLNTTVRFRILLWKTKRHKLDVKANVEVNDSGEKVAKNDIKLTSRGPQLLCYRALQVLMLIVNYSLLSFVS